MRPAIEYSSSQISQVCIRVLFNVLSCPRKHCSASGNMHLWRVMDRQRCTRIYIYEYSKRRPPHRTRKAPIIEYGASCHYSVLDTQILWPFIFFYLNAYATVLRVNSGAIRVAHARSEANRSTTHSLAPRTGTGDG